MPGYDSYGAPLVRPAGQAGGPDIPDVDLSPYQTSAADAVEEAAAASTAASTYQTQAAATTALAAATQLVGTPVVADVTNSGTTSETTLCTFTIPAGTFPNLSLGKFRASGRLTSTVGTVSYVWTLKLGGTTIFTVTAPGVTAVANNRKWLVELDLIVVDQTHQRWAVQNWVGNGLNAVISSAVNVLILGSTSTAVDMTSSRDLVLTSTLPNSSTADCILEHARLERIAA